MIHLGNQEFDGGCFGVGVWIGLLAFARGGGGGGVACCEGVVDTGRVLLSLTTSTNVDDC